MESRDGLFFGDNSSNVAANSNGSNDGWIRETTPEAFLQDVLDASTEVPVIVDFWGPNCAPCRQLTPMLEKAVTEARGSVRLVKMNVEDYPEVAQQLRITSIPAVMVFRDGRPVDGFLGAVPESQVKELVRRFAGEIPDDPAEAANERGERALEAGDAVTAAQYFSEALQAKPNDALAIGGLARAHVACGELEQARHVLAMAKKGDSEHDSIVVAYSALKLAEKSAELGSIEDTEFRLQQNPEDYATRFDLALVLHGVGRRSEAVAQLLKIVEKSPQWNEQAARKQLLELFDVYGREDAVSIEGRKQLSALLFR